MPRDPILAGMKLLDQLKRKNNNNVSTSSSSSHLSKSCSSRRVAKTTPSTGIVRGHAPVRRQREDTINEAINTIQTITQAAKARRQVVEQAASVFPRTTAPVLVKEANGHSRRNYRGQTSPTAQTLRHTHPARIQGLLHSSPCDGHARKSAGTGVRATRLSQGRLRRQALGSALSRQPQGAEHRTDQRLRAPRHSCRMGGRSPPHLRCCQEWEKWNARSRMEREFRQQVREGSRPDLRMGFQFGLGCAWVPPWKCD